MSEPTPIESSAIDEELVAYLDGELDGEASSRVERLLAADGTYRARLQWLQQAWDLLDLLPRAEVDDVFTQSTVEMVAIRADEEARRKQAARSAGQRMFWAAAAASGLAAAIVGYLVTAWVIAAPARRLARDLPVIENVDLYYNVDSIEFLRELDASGLFADDVEPEEEARDVP